MQSYEVSFYQKKKKSIYAVQDKTTRTHSRIKNDDADAKQSVKTNIMSKMASPSGWPLTSLRKFCIGGFWGNLLQVSKSQHDSENSNINLKCTVFGVTAINLPERYVCLRDRRRQSVRHGVYLAALWGPEWSPASWAAWKFCPSTWAGRTWWGPQTGCCTPAKHTQRPSK